MPCLLVLVAFFAPRLALAAMLVFSHALDHAYTSVLWPVLGFFFMPLTTLGYALAANAAGPEHGPSGFGFFMVLVASLVDLGVLGGGVRTRARFLPR